MINKHEVGQFVTIEAALSLYENGLALIITDGKYVQLEKEKEFPKEP